MINMMVSTDETVWLAPADFHEWLHIDRTNAAAPYYFYYPWLHDNPALRADLMARLQAHPPALLVFHRSQPVAGVAGWELEAFAPELTAWVDAHYVSVTGYEDVYVLYDGTSG